MLETYSECMTNVKLQKVFTTISHQNLVLYQAHSEIQVNKTMWSMIQC